MKSLTRSRRVYGAREFLAGPELIKQAAAVTTMKALGEALGRSESFVEKCVQPVESGIGQGKTVVDFVTLADRFFSFALEQAPEVARQFQERFELARAAFENRQRVTAEVEPPDAADLTDAMQAVFVQKAEFEMALASGAPNAVVRKEQADVVDATDRFLRLRSVASPAFKPAA